MIRHSHREYPEDPRDDLSCRLTPLGHETARAFGSSLPGERGYRIFHSPVERCVETARAIHAGICAGGGTATLEGSLPELIVRMDFPAISTLFERDKPNFFNFYVAGHYHPDLVEPVGDFARRAARKIWALHRTPGPPGRVDIFVTHDVVVAALEFGWAGLFREWEHWVQYLEGFLLRFNEEHAQVVSRGTTLRVPYPWWDEARPGA